MDLSCLHFLGGIFQVEAAKRGKAFRLRLDHSEPEANCIDPFIDQKGIAAEVPEIVDIAVDMSLPDLPDLHQIVVVTCVFEKFEETELVS